MTMATLPSFGVDVILVMLTSSSLVVHFRCTYGAVVKRATVHCSAFCSQSIASIITAGPAASSRQ